MDKLNLTQFLDDISADTPCGDNLEEDPAFLELEDKSRFVEERQMGDTIVPAQEPDWKVVRSLALELLERTQDIQVGMHLTCALLRTDGFEGLNQGLTLLDGWLEKNWDSVYPLQDPEDDYPMLRVNTLSSLSDYALIVNPISKIPLIQSDLGGFTWRDFEIGEGILTVAEDEEPQKISELDAFFSDNSNQEKRKNLVISLKSLVLSIKQSMEHVQSITKVVQDKAGTANAPNLNALIGLLQKIVKFANEKLQQMQALDAEVDDSKTDEPTGELFVKESVGKKRVKQQGINNRNDVIRTIDELCKYFERYEPSSPVPFLLLRAKKLLTMDFMEILRDLTPEAVNQAENICGIKKDQDN